MDITKDNSKQDAVKRYASTAILVGGGAIVGAALLANTYPKNYGTPFSYAGRQYYVQNDSRRVVYPSQQACIADVPVSMQSECEPVANYHSGAGGSWYGPLYSPRSSGTYRPSSQYPTEAATQSNFGKKLPSNANTTGFGSNGKAFTGSKGG